MYNYETEIVIVNTEEIIPPLANFLYAQKGFDGTLHFYFQVPKHKKA